MLLEHFTRFIGIDIHKKMAVLAVVNTQGQLLKQEQVPMNHLKSWGEVNLTGQDQVVIEATGNSFHVYDLLTPFAGEVVIANALAMHDRTRSRRKTDKVDALALALALAKDYIPRVWVPSQEVRGKREFSSHRHGLSRNLTALRNQLRGLLLRHGLVFPGADIVSDEAMSFIKSSELTEQTRYCLVSKFRAARVLLDEIKLSDQRLSKDALKDETCLKLITLPGIGPQAASIITSAIGDIHRFSSPKKLTSYAGLVPSVSQSADTVHYGPITKQGRNLLRWAIVEAAHAAILTPGPIQDRFQRLIRKGKHRNVATVAIARYLLHLIWYLLARGQVYFHATRKYLTYKFRTVLRKAYGHCPMNAAPTLVNSVMGWNHLSVAT